MRIERFSFREFGQEAPAAGAAVAANAKTFLPAGSSRAGVPPPPPPPRVYKEEDIKAAEREGYKKGFLEGSKDGHAQAQNEQTAVEEQLLANVERFANAIAPLFADYRNMVLQVRQDTPKVALAIARKVAGQALAENAQAVVDETAIRCCEAMLQEPALRVTVHASLADSLEQKLKSLAERSRGAADMVVVKSDDMPLADCRIEWQHGRLQRDTAQLWQQIEMAVENLSSASFREANTQLDGLKGQIPIPTEENTPGPEIV